MTFGIWASGSILSRLDAGDATATATCGCAGAGEIAGEEVLRLLLLPSSSRMRALHYIFSATKKKEETLVTAFKQNLLTHTL